MKTPDITPIQVRAALLWIFSFLALIGVHVGAETSTQITALAMTFTTALPVILIYADALIRKARAQNLTAIIASRDPVNAPPGESFVAE